MKTWKTHSTHTWWKLLASQKGDNPCEILNWKSTWPHEILTMFVKIYEWNRGCKPLISASDLPSALICLWKRLKHIELIYTEIWCFLINLTIHVQKLKVETWKSTWNHEFWLYSWKIRRGNVEGQSNTFLYGISLKLSVEKWKVRLTLWLGWPDHPVETRKAHSTHQGL